MLKKAIHNAANPERGLHYAGNKHPVAEVLRLNLTEVHSSSGVPSKYRGTLVVVK